VNYTNAWSTSDITQTQNVNNVTSLTGTGNPAGDYTTTTTSGFVQEMKSETDTTTIGLPIGVVINLLENLPVRFGAQHNIVYTATTSNTQVTSRTPSTSQQVFANGTVNNTLTNNAVTNTDEQNGSNLTIVHTNTFYYGMSWWPYKDVQIDFTGFAGDVLALNNYNLSFNFYF
jgi:hypothetical protein